MPRFPVTEEKEIRLEERMEKLGISEDTLVEKFIRGGGPGGQKINKTSSCVYLRDPASEIEVKCQRTRSQALNRYYARVELCERLEELIEGSKSAKQQEIEKIRRQKRKRSKRAKEKMLKDKKHRSQLKEQRSNPEETD